MRKQLGAAGNRFRDGLQRARHWLSWVMPRVAIVATALVILRLLFGKTWLFGDNVVGVLLELITFCAVFLTVLYYGLKGVLWL